MQSPLVVVPKTSFIAIIGYNYEVNRANLERLVWWPSGRSATPEKLAARAMVMGGWKDIAEARRRFGAGIFAKVLDNAPRGLFDAKSWNYWHKKTGRLPVPPRPVQPAPWPPR